MSCRPFGIPQDKLRPASKGTGGNIESLVSGFRRKDEKEKVGFEGLWCICHCGLGQGMEAISYKL